MSKPLLLPLALGALLLMLGCDERPVSIKPAQQTRGPTLVHEAGERHFSVTETPFSVSFDCYPVDLVRRIDVSGALATTAVTKLGAGASADPVKVSALALDGVPGTAEIVRVTPGSQLNLALDFGATFTISVVRLHFISPNAAPGLVKLFGEDSDLLASASEATKTLVLRLPPTRLRRMRIELTAANDQKKIRLADISVFPASSGPVPTVGAGFSIAQLPGVEQTATDGKQSSSRPTLLDLDLGTGEEGRESDASPRVMTLNLGSDHSVQQLRFTFNSEGNRERSWQHGAQVEIRDSATEAWTTLIDSSAPFTSTVLNLAGKKVRYIRITNKLGGNKGTGTGRLLDVAVVPRVAEHPPAKPILELPANKGAVAGVGVFDSERRLRRILVRARRLRATPTPVYFDGTDDMGRALPPGTYNVRTAISEIRARTVGAVGSKPPSAPNKNPSLPHAAGTGNPSTVLADRNGNVFIGSKFEEPDVDLRRVSADGRESWAKNITAVSALAVDDAKDLLYVARGDDRKDVLSRLTASTGRPVAFAGGAEEVVINIDPAGRLGVVGLALDDEGSGLFVSNRSHDRIDVLDKETGLPLLSNALSVQDPRAILLEPRRNKLWIASQKGVHRYRFTRGPNYRILPTPELSIGGLQDPFGIAIDAWADTPERLLVSDRGTCQVREFKLGVGHATPGGPFEHFGHCRKPGLLEDRGFFWRNQAGKQDWPNLALSPDGTLVVADRGNRRVQAFTNAGALRWTTFSEYVPSAEVDSVSPTEHRLLTGGFQYSVDVSAVERDPARGTIQWERTHNWEPDDGSYFVSSYFSPSVRRKLSTPKGTREFMFSVYRGRVLSVFQLEHDRPRRVGALGWSWYGPTGTEPRAPGMWSWYDKNKNQRIDFEAPSSESDEVDFLPISAGYAIGGKPWVDRDGGVILGLQARRGSKGTDIVRIPIVRWDSADENNPTPVYDWRKREVLIDAQTLHRNAAQVGTTTERLFYARTSGDNLWLNINAERSHDGLLNTSGAGFVSVNRVKKITSTFGALDDRTTSMALDPALPTLWYEAASGGSGYWIYLRDADGLPLFRIDAGTVPGLKEGWLDNSSGLSVVGSGTSRYLYAEAVLAGAVVVHHMTGLDTIKYSEQRLLLK